MQLLHKLIKCDLQSQADYLYLMYINALNNKLLYGFIQLDLKQFAFHLQASMFIESFVEMCPFICIFIYLSSGTMIMRSHLVEPDKSESAKAQEIDVWSIVLISVSFDLLVLVSEEMTIRQVQPDRNK